MSYQSIRQSIKTLIDSVSGLADVKNKPTLNFSGYPAVTIVQQDFENQFLSRDENLRTYTFMVRVFYDSASGGVNNAVSNLETVVENITNKIDDEEAIEITRTIASSLDSNETLIAIESVPNEWNFVESTAMIVQEITVNIQTISDITTEDAEVVPIEAGMPIGMLAGITYAEAP